MTRLQKLQLKQSEARQKLGGILDNETRSEEDNAERDKLTAELKALESDIQAAILTDGDGGDETRSEEPTEDRQLRKLISDASVTDYVAEALFDSKVDGASRELRQEIGLGPNEAPLDLFLPDEPGDLETRADVVSNVAAADAPADNQSSIAGRVFARGTGDYIGVQRPTVPVGTQTYVLLTGGAAADARSDGVAKDAEAVVIGTESVDPFRVTARYMFGIESPARLRGMEEALRADLTAAMSDKLDKLAVQGQAAVASTSPAVAGIQSSLTAVSDPTAESAFADYFNAYLERVDGKYSSDGMNVRLLVNAETFRHGKKTILSTGNLVPDVLDLPAGRFRASANMKATDTTIAEAISYTAGTGRRAYVQPVWRNVMLIRDPYTKASEGQVALTVHVLAGGAMVDTNHYLQHRFKVAA